MDLPARAEEGSMSSSREEIRRAVRTVEHADAPNRASVPARAPDRVRAAASPRPASAARCSTSPVRSARPAWPPKRPSMNVPCAAQVPGTSKPPLDREVRAHTGAGHAPSLSTVPPVRA